MLIIRGLKTVTLKEVKNNKVHEASKLTESFGSNRRFEFGGDHDMENIIGACVLGIIAIICFIFSYLQFNEKGFLFNNAYIYASKQERETMDKKPHYKQSGIVFALIGIIFLINAIDMILQTSWLFYLVIGIVIVAIAYAIISSVMIEKRHK